MERLFVFLVVCSLRLLAAVFVVAGVFHPKFLGAVASFMSRRPREIAAAALLSATTITTAIVSTAYAYGIGTFMSPEAGLWYGIPLVVFAGAAVAFTLSFMRGRVTRKNIDLVLSLGLAIPVGAFFAFALVYGIKPLSSQMGLVLATYIVTLVGTGFGVCVSVGRAVIKV